MRRFLLISLSFLYASHAHAIKVVRDGEVTVAKWKCKKYDFYAFSDAERDAYIAQASKSSNTLTVSDFEAVAAPAPEPKRYSWEELNKIVGELKTKVIDGK